MENKKIFEIIIKILREIPRLVVNKKLKTIKNERGREEEKTKNNKIKHLKNKISKTIIIFTTQNNPL